MTKRALRAKNSQENHKNPGKKTITNDQFSRNDRQMYRARERKETQTETGALARGTCVNVHNMVRRLGAIYGQRPSPYLP